MERVRYGHDRIVFEIDGVSSTIRDLPFCFVHDRVTTGIITFPFSSFFRLLKDKNLEHLRWLGKSTTLHLNFTSNGVAIPYSFEVVVTQAYQPESVCVNDK